MSPIRRSKIPIPWLIRTRKLMLRPLGPDDAPRVCELIAANLAFLQRWMTWAKTEPVSIEAKADQLRQQRRAAMIGGTQGFGMFMRGDDRLIGAIGTHPRIGAGAREIGYWIGEAFTRLGFTTEAAAALVRTGFEVQRLRRMEIHTDPDNAASIGVARTLGFGEQVVVRGCVLTAEGPVRDNVMWAMSRAAYADSPAAGAVIEVRDRHDRLLL